MIKIISECNSNIDNDDNDGNERGNTIKTQFQLCSHKVVWWNFGIYAECLWHSSD